MPFTNVLEVWSCSPVGPYYCPECREEYRKLPAFGRRFQGLSTDGTQGYRQSVASDFDDGEMPSTSSQPLGKRRFPSVFRKMERERECPPTSPRSPPSSSTRTTPSDPGGSVRCNYCPPTRQQVAVKTCLICGASMCSEHLRFHLESPVLQTHPLVAPTADISVWQCGEHKEAKKIYCRDCEECVCTMCTVIGAHQGHACVSACEAERDLRHKLRDDLTRVQQNEQVIQSRVAGLQEKKREIQASLEQSRDCLRQQYQAMREALDREEQLALQCVEREERRVGGGVQDELKHLEEGLSSFQSCLDTLERLSDSQGTERVKEQAFIMEYNKISKSVKEMSSPLKEMDALEEVDQARLGQLEEWAKRKSNTIRNTQDRDALRLFYGITPSLDPETAHPKLVLSEENTTVTYSDEPPSHSNQPARFSTYPQVLGSRSWDGGRIYWEMEVRGEGRWKIGVSDALIGRKGSADAARIGFNPHSWCLYGDRGKMEALHDKESFPVEGSIPEKVGVFLDIEGGSLSFYRVSEEGALTLLHSFEQAFSQPLYPALAVSKMQLSFCQLFQ
ncbi:hypothetical protein GJAV_G00245650 [Gymnothorax javanicus]|nr:hypothetical protein GJAV_G00245650 [Gymnothorax javanicus]